jgi:hypothetical protein
VILARDRTSTINMRSIRKSAYRPVVVGLETKETDHGSHGFCTSIFLQSSWFHLLRARQRLMTNEIYERRLSGPVRFSLAAELGQELDGAWWPHNASIARELPGLNDALRERLGQAIDIGVNWSPLQRVPDLDLINRRGFAATPGRDSRHLRVMTITGSRAKAHLLVVPSRTSIALAIMLLRQAADLPILYGHQHTSAFDTACAIVQAARAQNSSITTRAESSS